MKINYFFVMVFTVFALQGVHLHTERRNQVQIVLCFNGTPLAFDGNEGERGKLQELAEYLSREYDSRRHNGILENLTPAQLKVLALTEYALSSGEWTSLLTELQSQPIQSRSPGYQFLMGRLQP